MRRAEYYRRLPVTEIFLEPVRGFEPLTCGLRNRCSATELHRLSTYVRLKTNLPIKNVTVALAAVNNLTRYFIKRTGSTCGLALTGGLEVGRQMALPVRNQSGAG